jgi:hypothetical protein
MCNSGENPHCNFYLYIKDVTNVQGVQRSKRKEEKKKKEEKI